VASPQFINISSYFEIVIISVFWTYAIIMMINQRLTSEMKRAKDHFEAIFNTTPDAIVITNLTDGTITDANDKFYELSGYKPEESLGKTAGDLKLWFDSEKRDNYLSLIKQQGYCFDYEAVFQREDRKKITGLVSGRSINLNEKLQLISIIRNISERKKREELTKIQNAQLQEINSEKDKFFSIIAHDLRSPFSAFLGLTEIMTEKLPTLSGDEILILASQMRDSAKNLFGLLENLLQWSLIKRGIAKLNPEQIKLNPEMHESMLTYLGASQSKRISILLNVSENETVYADPHMLRSLIRNILSNAIKFTPEGGTVTISSERLPDNSCMISVRDTGIGISQKMQKLLFKIGADISRKGTSGEPSTGLGLLLCKEFVSMHHGEIWVESTEGEGSTFYVKFPPAEKT
jgi:PAS domain S-box-containing protein